MLIRSQDGMMICDMSQTLVEIMPSEMEAEDRYEIVIWKKGHSDDVDILGMYTSEEKATKVLDMIEHHYKYGKEPEVFKMPADNEVCVE